MTEVPGGGPVIGVLVFCGVGKAILPARLVIEMNKEKAEEKYK
jgi:hypothetical protein